VSFDPFGDFETRGYLRNFAAEKDRDIVRRLEHAAFVTGLDPAFRALGAAKEISYEHVLATHRALFDAVYPWAGQDRLATTPSLAVSKGGVLFAHPDDIRAAVAYALRHGQDTAFMNQKPGEIMGYLAYGHPFLDGNGRTIMVIHSVLAQRAGFSIDWAATGKTDYLTALTQEIDAPGKGHLDAYLAPFKKPVIAYDQLAASVQEAPGLDGAVTADANTVLGKTTEPAVQASYEQLQLKRKRT
jgi:cell filamentation protein